MQLNGLLLFYSYINFGFVALFLYQTSVNFFIRRQRILNQELIRAHLGLCAFSTLYTFFTFLLVMKFSVTFNLVLMHLTWISGSLVNFFYIRAIKKFLKDKSDNLKWIQILPLISGAGALICLLVWGISGEPILINHTTPFLSYNNIYMEHVGAFNPSGIVKGLGLLILISLIYSSLYFIRLILKSAKRDIVLLIGVCFTLLATFNDIIISVSDLTYLFPLMFAANVFEILRITHYNQKKLVHELHETTQDLIDNAKLSDIGSSYATLAHEILNPLQAAGGYLEKISRLLGKDQISPELQNCLDKITKQHYRIEILAKNVKKHAKVSSQIEAQKADLQNIIQESLDTVDMKARNAGVEIRYNPSQYDLKINCLSDQMIQVFTNLLNNSIEAVYELEERWIEMDHHMDESNNKIKFSIKDSGTGIAPELVDKIWEHRFTTKKENGVGLGLGLCRLIINRHGGQIYLDQKSDRTEFVIELPLT